MSIPHTPKIDVQARTYRQLLGDLSGTPTPLAILVHSMGVPWSGVRPVECAPWIMGAMGYGCPMMVLSLRCIGDCGAKFIVDPLIQALALRRRRRGDFGVQAGRKSQVQLAGK